MAASGCCAPKEPSGKTPSVCGPGLVEQSRLNGIPAAKHVSNGEFQNDTATVQASVRKYYGEVLKSSSDLKTSACCTPNALPKHIQNALRQVPDEVVAKYYGCGSALPEGIVGLRVVDLGSGSGRDCYLAAALVGPKGQVTGVDMTDTQLAVATKYVDDYCRSLGYTHPNLTFRKGTIENLKEAGIADSSVDIIISNCVINLSPDKPSVLREAFRVLVEGGEFFFSDIYCDRRLPAAVRHHEVLLGECLAGALYVTDFKRLCHEVGFLDPRILTAHEIEVKDAALKALVGEARFFSVTYRLFKLPGRMETACEDYGQVAIYKGSISESATAYQLDDHHRFEQGKPHLVCGNTAAMVGESWLKGHFEIIGDRSTHYGVFQASDDGATSRGLFARGSCC